MVLPELGISGSAPANGEGAGGGAAGFGAVVILPGASGSAPENGELVVLPGPFAGTRGLAPAKGVALEGVSGFAPDSVEAFAEGTSGCASANVDLPAAGARGWAPVKLADPPVGLSGCAAAKGAAAGEGLSEGNDAGAVGAGAEGAGPATAGADGRVEVVATGGDGAEDGAAGIAGEIAGFVVVVFPPRAGAGWDESDAPPAVIKLGGGRGAAATPVAFTGAFPGAALSAAAFIFSSSTSRVTYLADVAEGGEAKGASGTLGAEARAGMELRAESMVMVSF